MPTQERLTCRNNATIGRLRNPNIIACFSYALQIICESVPEPALRHVFELESTAAVWRQAVRFPLATVFRKHQDYKQC